MKPIRVLTPQLDILTEIDNYESLIFTRRWHRPGEFEMHINRHKKDTDKLQKGNLIMLDKDRHKVGIIKHKEIALDQQGKITENWLIKGWTLQGITKQRIILPPIGLSHDEVTGTHEAIMKHYINTCLVNPVDPARKVDMLTIAADKCRGEISDWQARLKDLDVELEKISLTSGLGWNIYLDFDLKRWVFEVYEGRDLTAGQDVNPPVIFSPDFDALKTQHYADSDINYKNVAYVGGQGEGVERAIVEVGGGAGLERIEAFVDARDLENAEDLPGRGQQQLSEMQVEKLLEAQILKESPFIYGRDYDLGDIVTIQNRDWGVTMDSRITEVREIYEPSGFQLEGIFGNSWPTLIDVVKRELGQVSAEVRR